MQKKQHALLTSRSISQPARVLRAPWPAVLGAVVLVLLLALQLLAQAPIPGKPAGKAPLRATTALGARTLVTLRVESTADRRYALTFTLTGRPLAAGARAEMRLMALSRPRVTVLDRLLFHRGRAYTAALHVPSGRWILEFAPARSGMSGSSTSMGPLETAYLLRLSSGSAAPSRIDSYLAPAGAAASAGSIPLGPDTATLRISPSTFGRNRFIVELRPRSDRRQLPSWIHAALTMEDMDMGVAHLTLRPLRPGVYAGWGMFDMGGLWRVALSRSGATASALLSVSATAHTSVSPASRAGYHPPVISTDFPYTGLVTEMGSNDVARLNGEVTSAGQTSHGVDLLAHRPFIYVTDMGGDAVQVINIHTGRLAHTVPVGLGPAHIVFTPDGARAYVTDFLSADVSVIDVRHNRLVKRIPVGLNPHGLDITRDGRYVYVACVHGAGVWIIDTRSNRVVGTIATGLEPYGVTMGPPAGGKVYVSDFALNQVDVVSLAKHRVVRRISVGKAPALMVATSNGGLYVADHESNAVSVIDMRTDRVIARVPVGAGPHGLDATPDGRFVYVANNNSNTVSIIATHSKKVVETVRVPGRPNEVALQQADDMRP